MRKIITFLGTRPRETSYEFEGKTYVGRVFAEALRQFQEYDEMLVFVTQQALQQAWHVLEALGDKRIRAIEIPEGKDEAQMWEMFDAITREINEGETVVFDITHGLRSLPFLVFLFAAYLKTAKNVDIQAIYYGALEMGNMEKGVPAPVIDLSPFVSMLDWLTATSRFIETGDARNLAALLNPPGKRKGSAKTAAEALLTVSQAAFLCQPFTLMSETGTLGEKLEQAEADLFAHARPFHILRDHIVQTFSAFTADFPQDVQGALRAEYRLIHWYHRNNQIIQATTLAREWLIDAVTWRLGEPLDVARTARFTMERAVSGQAMVGREVTDEQTHERRTFTRSDLNEFGRIIYDTWEEKDLLRAAWISLDIRNTLDHAQHRKDNPLIKTIISKMNKEIMPALEQLARRWGLD